MESLLHWIEFFNAAPTSPTTKRGRIYPKCTIEGCLGNAIFGTKELRTKDDSLHRPPDQRNDLLH